MEVITGKPLFPRLYCSGLLIWMCSVMIMVTHNITLLSCLIPWLCPQVTPKEWNDCDFYAQYKSGANQRFHNSMQENPECPILQSVCALSRWCFRLVATFIQRNEADYDPSTYSMTAHWGIWSYHLYATTPVLLHPPTTIATHLYSKWTNVDICVYLYLSRSTQS